MKVKLNQVVSLVKGRKDFADKALTAVHHHTADKFDGFTKSFRAIEEEQPIPAHPETKKVTANVEELIKGLKSPLITLLNTILTQDRGNQQSVGEVKVTWGNRSLNLTNVPVTHLLFLEAKLTDLLTLAQKLPVLDESNDWTLDGATSLWKTPGSSTIRTRKAQKALVLMPPTDKHPGQAVQIQEDIPSVEITTVSVSGRVSVQRRAQIIERIVAMRDAVVQAREAANSIEVEEANDGAKVFEFIFGA